MLDGIVVLMASAFGNVDAHGDVIVNGAYAKTIQEQGPGGANRIKHLMMHWPDLMIGKPLELEEVEAGLKVTSKVAKTTLGLDSLILYQEKVITEHSVGISVIKRNEDDQREILEARLWEYSAVTWGANPRTPTLSVKGLTGWAGESVIPTPLDVQIENASRALNTGISDGMCQTIEKWLDIAKSPHQDDQVPDQITSSIGQMNLLMQIRSLNRKIEQWKN